jgi:VWFA-related protein
MPARAFARCGVVAVSVTALSLHGLASSGQNPPAQQTRPQFRASTTLVPVDVRVLDRRGRPVTDLTQDDFTVLEDGVPQAISHFSSHAMVAMEPTPERARLLRTTRSLEAEPQEHRVFLILLGRGRLQGPSKGLDATLHFVRNQLLPQDLVAVQAWNRATDFTTDHGRIATLIERFTEAHLEIEMLLRLRFSGLAAVYGSAAIPDGIQRRIDTVFDGSEVRQVPEVPVTGARQMAVDNRRIRELLEGTATLDVMGADEAESLALSYDEFVDEAIETNQNLANLYTAIEYLRHVAGEKHLVYVSSGFLTLRRQEQGDSLAAVAADARVALYPIQTGGLGGGVGFAARDQRAIAELTGGRASAYRPAREAVDYIASATSFSYVLGYYPANQDWNGAQRRIDVRVNRPDVRVMYRRSYFANHELPPLDLREFTSYRRVTSAGNYDRDIPDIGIDAQATFQRTERREITIELTIAADRIALVQDELGLWVGRLKIAVFVGDLNENVVADSWQDMDLRLRPATRERFLAEGIPHTVTLTVPRTPSYVKVVVYDYAADLVGSRIVGVKR